MIEHSSDIIPTNENDEHIYSVAFYTNIFLNWCAMYVTSIVNMSKDQRKRLKSYSLLRSLESSG